MVGRIAGGRAGRRGTMPMVDLRRVLSDVTRVQAQLEAGVNLRLRSELGLSLVLFDSMTVIGEVEACRVQDLAAALYVFTGGASKLVDRLAALGYCRRLPNPHDRRSSLLRLTPIGQQRLAAAGRSWTRNWSACSGRGCQSCRSASSRPSCRSYGERRHWVRTAPCARRRARNAARARSPRRSRVRLSADTVRGRRLPYGEFTSMEVIC